MTQIIVEVLGPKAERWTLEVPDDVVVLDLARAIAIEFGLPPTSHDGPYSSYRLARCEPDGRLSYLDANQSLAAQGIPSGAVLKMVTRVTDAGEPGGTHPPERRTFGLVIYYPGAKSMRFETAGIDPHTPLWKEISRLVDDFGLPRADADQTWIAYHLELAEPRHARLPVLECLSGLDVHGQTVLDLIGEPVPVSRLKDRLSDVLSTEFRTDKIYQRDKHRRDRISMMGMLSDVLSLSDRPEPTKVQGYFFSPRDLGSVVVDYLKTDLDAPDDRTLATLQQLIENVTLARSHDSKIVVPHEERFTSLVQRPLNPRSSAYHSSGRPEGGKAAPGEFRLQAWAPEEVTLDRGFDLTVVISVVLDQYSLPQVSDLEQKPADFQVDLVTDSAFSVLGRDWRHITLPMDVGEHVFSTTFQIRVSTLGTHSLRLVVFYDWHYVGELRLSTTAVPRYRPEEVSSTGQEEGRVRLRQLTKAPIRLG